MSNITIPYNFTPRPYQLELFKAMDGYAGNRKKRALLRWHRRAGKDKACWCYLLGEAYLVKGNYFYVFPTKTMARQALWENIDSSGFKLLDHCPKELIARINNQEMLLELVNGSTIRILGFDTNPESIRGIACKGVVFSEFAFSDPKSYKTMIPALRESDGWAIFNSTPNGRNHLYDLWEATKESPNWFVSQLQTMWPDKPHYSGLLSSKQLEEIRREDGLTEEDMEREYGVSFETGMQGSYYTDQIQAAYSEGRIDSYLYDDTKLVNTYWDIGVDDTDACWFGQKVGNSIVWIDYFEKNNQGTDDIAQMLLEKGYQYDTHYLPHDADHRKKVKNVVTTASELEDSLQDFRVSGRIEVLPRTNSVQASILTVRKRFPLYRFDRKNCEEGLKRLEMYHRAYDSRRRVFLSQPKHDENSHAADAFRLEAESQDYRRELPNTIKVFSDFDIF